MADRLLPFALGALHAAILLWLLVALATAAGATRGLAAVGTLPGAALGLWLAALSLGATAWALRGQRLERGRERALLGRAGLAGFAAGALFVPGILLGASLVRGAMEPQALLLALFAAPFAGAFGSLLALLLAALDVGLFALAGIVATRA